jgi:putative membrane protein
MSSLKSKKLVAGAVAAMLLGVGAPCAACEEPIGVSDTQSTALSGPEVAFVLLAADEAGIHQATLALSHSQNAGVVGFAQMMIVDHQDAGQKVQAALASTGATALPSAVSLNLQLQAAVQNAELRELDGPAFDRAYIDIQVRGHESVLAIVQQALAINQPPAFANLLADAQSLIEQHLALALAVQGSLPE